MKTAPPVLRRDVAGCEGFKASGEFGAGDFPNNVIGLDVLRCTWAAWVNARDGDEPLGDFLVCDGDFAEQVSDVGCHA